MSRGIVIAGGAGQIGQILVRHFQSQRNDVTVLARHPTACSCRTVAWDAENIGPWAAELEGADVLINLAGRSVNCRYTPENRREIKESRVKSTQTLGKVVSTIGKPPRLWLNASTATIYRHALDRPMDEHTGELGGNEPGAPSAWNFSIDVARCWEAAFFDTPTPATRKVALRSAMVMSPDAGGIFDTLLTLVRAGLGGTSGTGRQYVSWLHDADFTAAIDFVIARPEIAGVLNISSPHPLPNREFMRTLRQAWGMPIGLPATSWMLEAGAVFLRTETELILKSRRVVPARLLESGFAFTFPLWADAAIDLVRRRRTQ